MASNPVRIGLIGCGTQAHVHFRGLQALGRDKTIVTAICDLDPKRLTEAADLLPEARTSTDYRDMLEGDILDLVIIATMPNTHHQMALASLEAGAHILCEKPFMMNAGEAEEVLAKAAQSKRQVQLGTNMRYLPSSQHARQLMASQEIGKPVYIKAWGCHKVPPAWAPHYHLATSGGGVLASTLVHTLDLAMWVALSPNPLSVSASTSRLFPTKRGPKLGPHVHQRYDAEDLIGGFIRFDDGSYCALEGNWCSEVTDFHSFQITAERGTITGSPYSVRIDREGEVEDLTPSLEEDNWSESIWSQDAEIVDKLQRGEPWSLQDARQLLNLQKVIDACYESARRGREVLI